MIRLALPLVLLTVAFWVYFFLQRGAVRAETRKALRQWGLAATGAVLVLVLIGAAFSLKEIING